MVSKGALFNIKCRKSKCIMIVLSFSDFSPQWEGSEWQLVQPDVASVPPGPVPNMDEIISAVVADVHRAANDDEQLIGHVTQMVKQERKLGDYFAGKYISLQTFFQGPGCSCTLK